MRLARKCRTQKSRQKSPSGHYRTTLSGYIFATKAHIDNRKKKMLSSNISSTYPHNMVNFGALAAEIDLVDWGTPVNFNGFCILASLLQRPTSLNASQPNFARCLAVTCAGRLYIHFWQLLPRNGILLGTKFTLHPPSLALSYWQHYCTAFEQWAWAILCGVEHRAPPIFGRAIIGSLGHHS